MRIDEDDAGAAKNASTSNETRFLGGVHARALRLRRKLTLDQLAAAAGLSKGHLSRFERGEKMLSVAALMRLASALDTSTSMLLGETVDTEAVHVVRFGRRHITHAPPEAGGYAFALLSRSGDGGELDVFTIDLAGGVTVSGLESHAGQESFYVLSGEVEVRIGPKIHRLDAGDYIEFPGTVQHSAVSRTESSSVLVIVARR